MEDKITFVALEAFEQWLKDQPPGSIVGKLGEPEEARADVCPLATCLNSLRPNEWGWSVGMDFFSLKRGSWWIEYPRAALPLWGSCFTRVIDSVYPGNVTREQALECLDIAKRRAAGK